MRNRPRSRNRTTSRASAVCIRCGCRKGGALQFCSACGFAPLTAEDRARSLMLSPLFDVGESTMGLSDEALADAARTLREGRPWAWDAGEVARVAALHSAAESLTPLHLASDLARWLLPPLALLAGILWLATHS